MPSADRRRARRLQLRHLLDLHQADAARRVDAQTGVVAVVRDLDAGFDGRLQHRRALRDGHLRPSMVSVTFSMGNLESYQASAVRPVRTSTIVLWLGAPQA